MKTEKLRYIGRFGAVEIENIGVIRRGDDFDFPAEIAGNLKKQVHRVKTGKVDKDGNPIYYELPQWETVDGEKVETKKKGKAEGSEK